MYYLIKIKEFFLWLCCDLSTREIHNEIWDEMGPI